MQRPSSHEASGGSGGSFSGENHDAGGGDVVIPDFLSRHDHVWLRFLIEQYERFHGRPRRELATHLWEPLPVPCPAEKRRRATAVLDGLTRPARASSSVPRQIREQLFAAAAAARSGGAAPGAVRARVARALGLPARAVDDLLFADLPGERSVVAPPGFITPLDLAVETNLSTAQGFLRRASRVDIELSGNARSVIGLARLRGLICVVARAPVTSRADVVVSMSGPLSIFRHTLVYGRRLATLVPALAWCHWFRLRAQCTFDEQPVTVQLQSGDPILPGKAPRPYDSKLEERFAREFSRAAPDWDLVREPEPIAIGNRLIFPDFALVHRRHRARRWLLEIVGFWTPEYLLHKLESLRAANRSDLIVCIDSRRNCGTGDIPLAAHVLAFERRIDPMAVLRLIEDGDATGDPSGRL